MKLGLYGMPEQGGENKCCVSGIISLVKEISAQNVLDLISIQDDYLIYEIK